MRNNLAHDEIGCGLFRPRHPIVCALDLAGLMIAISVLAIYQPMFMIAILPATIAWQFAVSALYHWVKQNRTLQCIDHLAIVFTIAATYVPYWGTKLPEVERPLRFGMLLALVFLVGYIRLFKPRWEKAGEISYAVLTGFGLVYSFFELPRWLPPMGLAGFWIGVGFYVAQFAVYMARKPDSQPFGYRELQHVLLLFATTIHMWVVITYL